MAGSAFAEPPLAVQSILSVSIRRAVVPQLAILTALTAPAFTAFSQSSNPEQKASENLSDAASSAANSEGTRTSANRRRNDDNDEEDEVLFPTSTVSDARPFRYRAPDTETGSAATGVVSDSTLPFSSSPGGSASPDNDIHSTAARDTQTTKTSKPATAAQTQTPYLMGCGEFFLLTPDSASQ